MNLVETFWYTALTFMLAMYIVLDGFDFGVGIVYLLAAKTERERRAALASIGPVWSGNEVWLIASGGLLFFAFPKAYAAGFSGFYLALIMVLWLLIFRGLGLELRSHLDHALWQRFWDVAFAIASLLLAVVFGAALGNLIRGVPLNADGYFFVPFWTTFAPGPEPGILDWYTLLTGLTSAAILALHGANYLAMKTEEDLRKRARRLARLSGFPVVGLVGLAVAVLPVVRPDLRLNYSLHPIGYLFPFTGFVALATALYFRTRERDLEAFCASGVCIFMLLSSAAWGVYPNILIATGDPAYSLTVTNATAGPYGLQVGLTWFLVGFSLVIAYTIYVHCAFWGKVRPDLE